jgi:hypothetical protein
MAGQPRKRAMLAELERRALAYDGGTLLDYVDDWVSNGGTLSGLAESITDSLKKPEGYITRHMVSKYVNSLPGGPETLQRARQEGAHGLADSGVKITDDAAASGDRDVVTGAKAQADYRLRLAGFWNKGEYAPQRDAVNVNLNLGQLHLDALRTKQIAARTHHTPITDGTPDVETVVDDG